MARCPICKEELDGFSWTKTKTGKNWLADKEGKWHDCPANRKDGGGKRGYKFGCDAPKPHTSYYFEKIDEPNIGWWTGNKDEPDPKIWKYIKERWVE